MSSRHRRVRTNPIGRTQGLVIIDRRTSHAVSVSQSSVRASLLRLGVRPRVLAICLFEVFEGSAARGQHLEEREAVLPTQPLTGRGLLPGRSETGVSKSQLSVPPLEPAPGGYQTDRSG